MAPKIGIGDQLLGLAIVSTIAYRLLPFHLFVLLLIGGTTTIIFYLRHKNSHWKRIGVPSPKANLLFGNTFDLLKSNGVNYYKENFDRLGQTFGGYLLGLREMSTMDLDILRSVFVKEFGHFQDRMFLSNTSQAIEEKSILRNAMSAKKGDAWKRVRNRVTPAFTTGKIKRLIPFMNDSTNQLCKVIEGNVERGEKLDLKDLFGRFALDVIGRAGFTLDMNTFDQHSENAFYINAKKVFQNGFMNWRVIIITFFPFIAYKFEELTGIDLLETDTHRFFRDFLLQLYDQRKAEKAAAKESHNDIFQLLIDVVDDEKSVAKTANIEEDADIVHKEISSNPAKHISTMELVAQGFILLVAGYETTGSTLHFIVYCLAALPKIQEKVREEIMEVVGDEKEITYEHIKKLIYLDQVVQETLRMYPAASRVNRVCNKPITLNGIPIEVGDLVTMPIYSLHHNADLYPDPERFDPDRFTAEEKARRDPLTYVPFGYGPRNCIGMRFAEFEIRTCLAIVLRNFRFHKIDGSPDLPIKLNTREMTRPTEVLCVLGEKI